MDQENINRNREKTSSEIRYSQARILESFLRCEPDFDELVNKYQDILHLEIIVETGNTCVCAAEFERFLVQDAEEKMENFSTFYEWIQMGMCSCLAKTPSENSKRVAAFNFVHAALSHDGKDLKFLKFLVEKGCDLNKPTDYLFFTPLYLAIAYKNIPAIEFMLSKDVDVNLKCTDFKLAPLALALDEGYMDIVKLLLTQEGIDVNVKDSNDDTPLTIAIKQADEELLTLVLEAGANPNIGDRRMISPLLLATTKGVNFVRKLISYGADVNTRNYHGKTALFCATYQENEEIVEELLKAGADPNDECDILLTAVYQENLSVVKLLVDNGAEVGKGNEQGYTPIHIAAWNGLLDILKYLLEKGAKHDELTQDKNTPLSLAAHGKCSEIIKHLLPLGCNVNNADKDLDTALLYATYNGMTESVQLLMEYGADPNLRNRLNTSCLWNAVFGRHKDVVKLLLAANVNMEVNSRGIDQHAQTNHVIMLYPTPKSPLYLAVDRGAVDILLLLKAAGYNVYGEEWLYKEEYPPGTCENLVLMNILKQFASTPPRLITVCRNFLRRQFGNEIKQRVCELDIPNSLKNYLVLSDCLT